MIFPLALIVGTLVRLASGSYRRSWFRVESRWLSPPFSPCAVVTPIIFFASYGHGYLAPVGVMILAVALAQVMTIIGYGEFFPWAIPGVYAQGGDLGMVSLVIVVLTCIVGVAGTLLWWEFADQTH